MESLNEEIVRLVNQWVVDSPAVSFLVPAVGVWLGWVLILYVAWHYRAQLRQFLPIITLAIVTWVLASLIQSVYVHPRPFLVLPEIVPLINATSVNSFPSGHAAFFFALAAALYFKSKPLANLYVFCALLISLARVAAGIHWPADIVGGLFLALLVVLPSRAWFR